MYGLNMDSLVVSLTDHSEGNVRELEQHHQVKVKQDKSRKTRQQQRKQLNKTIS